MIPNKPFLAIASVESFLSKYLYQLKVSNKPRENGTLYIIWRLRGSLYEQMDEKALVISSQQPLNRCPVR